jgi:hypothetical protein
MTTKARVEETLIGMYGHENLAISIHEYYNDRCKKHMKMTLYYTKRGNPLGEHGGNHVGSYKPETKEGWYFVYDGEDNLPKTVMV